MLLFFLILNLSTVNAIPNPAAVYCKNLGYKYKIVQVKGGEKGICIFPDKECEEWEFFAGKCGTEYSYCVKNGYDIETAKDGKNPFSPEYAICVPKVPGLEKKSVTDLMNFNKLLKITIEEAKVTTTIPTTTTTTRKPIFRRIRMEIANFFRVILGMDFSSASATATTCTDITSCNSCVLSPLGCEWCVIDRRCYSSSYCNFACFLVVCINLPARCSVVTTTSTSTTTTTRPTTTTTSTTTTTTIPSTFDWRNKNGQNWMTDVKDQGPWGTCWAFASIGAVEAKIKIVKNDPNFDINLSEQDIISCSDGGDCNSGNFERAIKYINDAGVVEEDCFPYNENFCDRTTCSDKCLLPSKYWKIDNYGIIIDKPRQDLENYLINKGPLVAYLYMNGTFDQNGIYRGCTHKVRNHVITITGYNDTGGYWIGKNSWGSDWNGDGYFKIGYDECWILPMLFVDTPYYCKALNQPCSASEPCCSPSYCSYGVCQYAGGGCPVLKVWDGNEYKDVVKLNIHSERGKDTTKSIGFTMEPKDGKYYVKLSEIWYAMLEGSHIDSVKLTDDTGNECKLVSAIHDKNGDVLTAITKSDDVRVETKPGEEIDLTFDGCSGKTFTFTVEGYNNRPMFMKEAFSSTNIILIIITIITVIVIVYGAFKFFFKKMIVKKW
jgi:hypothetical protein